MPLSCPKIALVYLIAFLWASASSFSIPYQRNARLRLPHNSCLYNNPNPLKSTCDEIDERLSSFQRLVQALPRVHKLGDDLDKNFLRTFLPNMANLAVVPLVNSVDTFWVGRMGIALALAGQAAANQTFFTLYFLVAFLPTITAPLVAKSNREEAADRVCEALFLSVVFGCVGTGMLMAFPVRGLSMVLSPDALAMEYAVPYVRLRALSMVPALISATGFAAFRGLLDTVTPLKVSLLANLINLVLDPLCIFGLGVHHMVFSGYGASGAALATAMAETASGLIYIRLLLRKKLIRFSKLIRPPSWSALQPLIRGGSAILLRQAILNISFLAAARKAQYMDPSGVSAAAYGIVSQIFNVGVVVFVALQGSAATMIPSARALASPGKKDDAGRRVADRLFLWGLMIGCALAALQLTLLPVIIPLFSILPEVRDAVKLPALISAFIHIVNGPLFAGEGALLGLECFGALAGITGIGVGVMLLCLGSPLGKRLDGVLWSIAVFHVCQMIMLIYYHLRVGPLRRRSFGFGFWRRRRNSD